MQCNLKENSNTKTTLLGKENPLGLLNLEDKFATKLLTASPI